MAPFKLKVLSSLRKQFKDSVAFLYNWPLKNPSKVLELLCIAVFVYGWYVHRNRSKPKIHSPSCGWSFWITFLTCYFMLDWSYLFMLWTGKRIQMKECQYSFSKSVKIFWNVIFPSENADDLQLNKPWHFEILSHL